MQSTRFAHFLVTLRFLVLIFLGLLGSACANSRVRPRFDGDITSNPTSIRNDFAGLDIDVQVLDSNYLGKNPLLVVVFLSGAATFSEGLDRVDGVDQASEFQRVAGNLAKIAPNGLVVEGTQFEHHGFMQPAGKSGKFSAHWTFDNVGGNLEPVLPYLSVYVILYDKDLKECARQSTTLKYNRGAALTTPTSGRMNLTPTPFQPSPTKVQSTKTQVPATTPTSPSVPPLGTVLLSDMFDGSSINTTLWQFATNSSGGRASLSDGNLIIQSGVTSGGGASVKSKSFYPTAGGGLALETRARVTQADGGVWGFYIDRGAYSFYAKEGQLTAAIESNSGSNATYAPIPNVDPTVWHTYKLEFSPQAARFYVDGVLKHTATRGLPNSNAQVVLDRVSWGKNQILTIDYVELRTLTASAP